MALLLNCTLEDAPTSSHALDWRGRCGWMPHAISPGPHDAKMEHQGLTMFRALSAPRSVSIWNPSRALAFPPLRISRRSVGGFSRQSGDCSAPAPITEGRIIKVVDGLVRRLDILNQRHHDGEHAEVGIATGRFGELRRMLDSELHSGAELLRQLAELDEIPLVGQRPMLELSRLKRSTPCFFDDLPEAGFASHRQEPLPCEWSGRNAFCVSANLAGLETDSSWGLAQTRNGQQATRPRQHRGQSCRRFDGS